MRVQKTELVERMNKIKGVVPKKSSHPVLQGLLAKDGCLIANNMEMSVKVRLEGVGDECFIIPDRAFDLINNLPDGEVEISTAGENAITIQADRIKNWYQTPDPGQFPEMAAPRDTGRLTIKASLLLESMGRVSYAIPAQNSNVTMTAMCLRASGGQLNFVGLDGHVLAWDKVDYGGEFELLVPKNTVDKLKSLGLSGDVRITHGRAGAVFATEDFEVCTRLVEGQYFKYQAMFGREMPLHTVVSRAVLLEAMVRAKACTGERCPVRFELQGDSLSLSIKDRIAEYHEMVDLQGRLEEPLTIGFDARLVLETLKAFDCGNVGLSFGGPKMPMVVEAEDSDFKALVLPVAIA